VWLEGYNLSTNRPSKKLSDKRYGPFKIISKVGAAAYKLRLPRTWKSVWPVFNELLLSPYHHPHFATQQHAPPPPPDIVNEHEEYKVLEVMDSKLYRGQLKYLIQWKGYPERHEWTWEPLANLENAQDAIKDFHRAHPSAPRPTNLDAFTFTPIQNFTEPPPNNIPSWNEGKIQPDAWEAIRSVIADSPSHDDPHTSWIATPIDDWNGADIPCDDGWTTFDTHASTHWDKPKKSSEPSNPPPPRRPPHSFSKPTDDGHSSMHWSFYRTYDCPYHRGENSWYY
jgi:hypothetical protein